MSLSMSRSRTMLKAFAPPAARAPPTIVRAISETDGIPLRATNIVGRVVTRRSSMILGLVRAV